MIELPLWLAVFVGTALCVGFAALVGIAVWYRRWSRNHLVDKPADSTADNNAQNSQPVIMKPRIEAVADNRHSEKGEGNGEEGLHG